MPPRVSTAEKTKIITKIADRLTVVLVKFFIVIPCNVKAPHQDGFVTFDQIYCPTSVSSISKEIRCLQHPFYFLDRRLEPSFRAYAAHRHAVYGVDGSTNNLGGRLTSLSIPLASAGSGFPAAGRPHGQRLFTFSFPRIHLLLPHRPHVSVPVPRAPCRRRLRSGLLTFHSARPLDAARRRGRNERLGKVREEI